MKVSLSHEGKGKQTMIEWNNGTESVTYYK